jgi:ABC-2 type transport system permease protein
MQHVRAALADLRQAPGHGAVIVFGPAGLLIFFSLTRVTGPLSANFFLASAAVLAIVGAAFNQMGAGLAHDRGRCLSDPSAPPVAGRIGARAIGTAMIAGAGIVPALIVSLALGPPSMSAATWVFLALSLVIGSVPIILAAMCVALWARPEAARTIANIVFFLFSFGAGLVLPPWSLPRLVWQASVILPSRHLADVAWAPALGWDLALGNWAWLAGFTAVLGGAAALGLRRAVRQA